MDGAFFGFAPYHLLLAGCGMIIVAGYWLPRYFSGREPAASGLLILGGLAVFGVLPGLPAAISPLDRPAIWEKAAEFAVIIALFGTGIRIDRVTGRGLWTPTVRLLAVAMPLSMLATGMLGIAAGLTLAGAVLLAAVLAPTDPVLAADVQVGPPLEGGEHPVRFALTTEAGLNDGLAFPFVYLAIFIAATAGGAADWFGEWLALYVGCKIAIGVAAGAAAGWLLGRVLFALPLANPLAETGSGVIALAGVLLTYGLTELLEGYGFIAAFVMGIVLRRKEAEHEYHGRLHSFSEALEHSVTAILLVMLGGAIPALLPYLGWAEAGLGVALVFLIRPASGMLALLGTELSLLQRGVVAFYGVRGVGSIYYLAYAGGHIDWVDEGSLWATIVFTILLSTIVTALARVAWCGQRRIPRTAATMAASATRAGLTEAANPTKARPSEARPAWPRPDRAERCRFVPGPRRAIALVLLSLDAQAFGAAVKVTRCPRHGWSDSGSRDPDVRAVVRQTWARGFFAFLFFFASPHGAP